MNKKGQNGIRVLVVDDEASVCAAIKMMLEHYEHNVTTADGAQSALALMEKEKFDLIITDYSMGDMKGDRMAAIIKQKEPTQPIIMVTAFAEDFHKSGVPTVAVDAVVSKPFSMTELRAAITQVMG